MLEKSFDDDDDELGSDSDDSSEEETTKTCQVHGLTSNMDAEVQNLLDNQENVDLDQLEVKYKKLKSRYECLEKRYLALQNKYAELQQNTIPKPPAPAHEWLIQLGRLCDAKPKSEACQPMARALGIDVLDLINLIGNSKTQTARTIMDLKLTAEQKATWTHENVPATWRTAIHNFVRLIVSGEPYSKYKTNEAINGYLREAKRTISNNGERASKRQKVFDSGNDVLRRSPSILNVEH